MNSQGLCPRTGSLANPEAADVKGQATVDKQWVISKNVYIKTTMKITGFQKKKRKDWITPGTWSKIEERRKLKERLLNTKSSRLLEQVESAYKSKDREVKHSAYQDKRIYIERRKPVRMKG